MSAEPEPTTAAASSGAAPPAAPDAPASTETTTEAAVPGTTVSEADKDAVEKPSSSETHDAAAPTHDKSDEKETTETKEAPSAEDEVAGATVPAPEDSGSAAPEAKSHKRRSSAGVPEHKSKKGSKKKVEALHLDAKPGDYYFARMKGWPPWPAMICDEEILPETLLSSRPVTAMRSDGSYRADFEDGGKNVRERLEEIKKAKPDKKSKALWAAYEVAQEGHGLDYFKDLLLQHERDLAEAQREAAEAEREAEEKAAAAAAKKEAEKEEKKKAAAERRKSKGGEKKAAKADKSLDDSAMDVDGDTSMAADGATKAKANKKRKKGVDEDESELAEDKESAKAKPKKAAKPSPPRLSDAELKAKREREVLYLRHKLQKGFLTRDVAPKEEEMQQMAEFFGNLENYNELETSIIRTTKIHKVLKNIIKLNSIPKDEEYRFKQRSIDLLEVWHKALADDTTDSPVAKEDGAANGVAVENGEGSHDKTEEATPAPKDESTDVKASVEHNNGAGESANAEDQSVLDTTMVDAPPAEEPATKPAEASAPPPPATSNGITASTTEETSTAPATENKVAAASEA